MFREERRCPGEKYTITLAICKGRQKRRYPRCLNCQHRSVERFPEPHNSNITKAHMTKEEDIFKEYDVRGIYREQLNETHARRIGYALAQYLRQQKAGVKNIVVGRDMRTSSLSLAQALMEGITSCGINVIDIGLVSTETSYFGVAHYGYDGSVMVTASHNPAKYNGFKICREKAIPIGSETGLLRIKELTMQPPPMRGENRGKVIPKDVLPDYKAHIQKFARDLKPLRVVVDAGNGMAGKMAPLVFEGLPCQIIPLYFELDGTFPNRDPNPLKEENLRALQDMVKKTRANLGVAFDGDADRCTFVDEKGEIVKNDLITALIAREFLSMDKGATIVYDLRSSWVVREEILLNGGVPYRERVGHAFMKATLRDKNAVFGGELSGHYYFRDNFYCDSALIAMIQILNILSRKAVSMSNLVAPLKKYYSSGEINFSVADKDGKLQRLAEAFSDGKIDFLDGVTVEYPDWWFNARKSGTEPLLRVNVEGKNKEQVENALKKLKEIIERN
ncbi:MAG TPA: phosphomannomutase/phosphoglucomutase [Candidatus Hypogeohydataceae bacterium YC41]